MTKRTANQRDTCSPKFTATLFKIARTQEQPKCPLTDGWIKMWYIYTMGCNSAMKRNEIGLFVVMWMNLESVIQSEVTQKEKTNIVHRRVYIESRKMELMNIFQGRNTDADIEDMWTQGGANWKVRTDISTLSCVKQTLVGAVSHRELSSVLREDQGGMWWERGAQEGGHMSTHRAGYCYLTAESNTTLHRNYTPL